MKTQTKLEIQYSKETGSATMWDLGYKYERHTRAYVDWLEQKVEDSHTYKPPTVNSKEVCEHKKAHMLIRAWQCSDCGKVLDKLQAG